MGPQMAFSQAARWGGDSAVATASRWAVHWESTKEALMVETMAIATGVRAGSLLAGHWAPKMEVTTASDSVLSTVEM